MLIEQLRATAGRPVSEGSRVIVVSPGELRALLRDTLRDALSEVAADRTAVRPLQEWLDSRAVAEVLGVCTRTVAHLARRRELSSSRVGRLLRFRRADVDAFIASRRIGSSRERSTNAQGDEGTR